MSRPHRGFAKFSKVAVLLCLAALPLTACTQSMNATSKPEYRENQNPQHAYRVTMAIAGAPGPFAMIIGFAQYDVVNTECLPPPENNPGGRSSPVPTRSLRFSLDQLSDGEYAGTVYADGMVDEDYHGRDVCRWELQNIQVQLKATGEGAETLFMADLYGEEARAGKAKTLHYSKHSYPRHPESKMGEPLNSGQVDRARMASWLTDDDVFSITLVAREASP